MAAAVKKLDGLAAAVLVGSRVAAALERIADVLECSKAEHERIHGKACGCSCCGRDSGHKQGCAKEA